MNKDFICVCGYMWRSRKTHGSPSKCPSCGSKEISSVTGAGSSYQSALDPSAANIKPATWLPRPEEEIETPHKVIAPKIHSGSHAYDLYKSSNSGKNQNEGPLEKAERMKFLREVIRKKVKEEG